jgi:hypothetical protein
MRATAVPKFPEGGLVPPVARGEAGDPALQRLSQRVRAEFLEMPGLRLTADQARRLFGIPDDLCQRILLTLIADGVLLRGADERFGLRSDN